MYAWDISYVHSSCGINLRQVAFSLPIRLPPWGLGYGSILTVLLIDIRRVYKMILWINLLNINSPTIEIDQHFNFSKQTRIPSTFSKIDIQPNTKFCSITCCILWKTVSKPLVTIIRFDSFTDFALISSRASQRYTDVSQQTLPTECSAHSTGSCSRIWELRKWNHRQIGAPSWKLMKNCSLNCTAMHRKKLQMQPWQVKLNEGSHPFCKRKKRRNNNNKWGPKYTKNVLKRKSTAKIVLSIFRCQKKRRKRKRKKKQSEGKNGGKHKQ